MKKEILIWKITTFLIFAALIINLYTNQVQAGQVHMQNALTALQTAKVELQNAAHDKGGHRTRALGYVNSAIQEVMQGIKTGAAR